jgi:Flp pilus assembly protein TadB
LQAATDEGPPLGTEFAACLQLMELGLPIEEALRKMAGSAGLFEYWLLYHAILSQRQTGADLAALLDSLAGIVHGRLRGQTFGDHWTR